MKIQNKNVLVSAPPNRPDTEHLVYQTAHNMKGGISTIQGVCTMAKKQIKDAEAIEYFTMVADAAGILKKLVTDLLEVSKTGAIEAQSAWIDLQDFIAEIIDATPLERKHVNINVSLPEDASWYGDHRLLRNCMLNLVQNAVKYHDANSNAPTVDIMVATTPSEWTFTIIDNGIGIESAAQAKLFNAFFRGNDQFQGHGLGLYLTHLSAQRLGGTIEFESTVGIGSTFILRLPKSFPN